MYADIITILQKVQVFKMALCFQNRVLLLHFKRARATEEIDHKIPYELLKRHVL